MSDTLAEEVGDLFKEDAVKIEIEEETDALEEAMDVVASAASTDVAVVSEVPAPVVSQGSVGESMVALAINKNLDIEKLKAVMEMQFQMEEREAKRQYDLHFSEMQREFTPIGRSKTGYKYKYAPIEVLQSHFGPVIAKHGFSYRWREEMLESGWKRTTMIISGYGHSEENSFDAPPLDPKDTEMMNTIQQAGTQQTYGRRYTFIPGFAITIEDEDTDATFDAGVKYADYINGIEAQTDLTSLFETVKDYRNQLREQGDQKGIDLITKIYDKRKKALS